MTAAENRHPGSGHRILFYVERDLHLPFLEPIFDWFQANGDCELAFAVPQWRESFENAPGFGLPPAEVQRLAAKGRLVGDPRAFQPDVTVCADACTHLHGCGKLVFVGHGIISKGAFYTSNAIVRRENMADLICVPGPLHRQIMERNVFTPIKVTGFIKSDRMFAAGVPDRTEAKRQFGIPPEGQVVLYAPTYNPEMSSLYVLGEQVAELCADGIHLLVKLHTMTDRRWKEGFRALSRQYPTLHYCEGIDVTAAMLAADLLVTDVSSVMAEFMFLDRPVVVVDNPRLSEFPLYIPDDIEYRVRDTATIRVGSLGELQAAVRRSLADPEELSGQRRAIAEALCFGRDGRAAERCGQAIQELLHQPGPRHDLLCTVVVDWSAPPSEETARRFENRLQGENPDVGIRCLHSGLQQPTGLACCFSHPYTEQWFNELKIRMSGDYLVVLRPDNRFPPGWLRRLSLHLRWNEKAMIVQPLSHLQDLRQLIGDIMPAAAGQADAHQLSAALFMVMCGFGTAVTQPNDQCVMMRRSYIDHLALPLLSGRDQVYHYLFAAANRTTGLSVQALDILSWPGQGSSGTGLGVNASGAGVPLVSIIIPLYNKVELTARCLETLFQHTPAELFELILVDNNSTDRTTELLAMMPASVRVLRNSTNNGFALACNQGAQAACGDLLLFLNNDTELLAGWLEPLLITMASDPTIGATGSRLLFPDGTIQHAGVVIVDDHASNDPLCGKHIWHGMSADTPEANSRKDFKALTAACLLVRASAFQEVGGFDEGYWNGYEDVDLCFKLGCRGWRLVYEPGSTVIHHESKSGHERFAKVVSNIERLHTKWLGKIHPDIKINRDGTCEWLAAGGMPRAEE